MAIQQKELANNLEGEGLGVKEGKVLFVEDGIQTELLLAQGLDEGWVHVKHLGRGDVFLVVGETVERGLPGTQAERVGTRLWLEG